MNATPEYKWYVIYTKPRNEKKVAFELSVKGIQNYCPLIKTMRQWSDRKKIVEVPLFNSYLFVFVSEREFLDVLTVKSVVKFITFEGKAIPISEYQIEAIRRTLHNEIKFEISTINFKIGQKVEIIKGILSGVMGEIVTISGKKQLLLRIENIGYSLLININQSDTKIRN